MKAYESGEFQGGNNKYTKALKVLYCVFAEEYKKFSWRNHNFPSGSEEVKKDRELRESQEFRDLLLKALNTKLSKEKFIIVKGNYYAKKETSRHLFYTLNKDLAKKYDFKQEAEDTIRIFHLINSEVISI